MLWPTVRNGDLLNLARAAALPVAIAISLATAACGGGTPGGSAAHGPPSPAVLTSKIKAALRDAKSVHVSGTVNQGGKLLGVDLTLTHAGGISGQLSVNNAGITVLSTHGSTYIKVTSAFIKYQNLPATACVLVCGKWFKATPAQSQQFVGYISMSSLFGEMTSSPRFRYAGTATVDGQTTWVLRAPDGSTAYVAAHGTPYPLRLVGPAHRGQINFTRWNTATIPGPPPANQVVDLSKLEG